MHNSSGDQRATSPGTGGSGPDEPGTRRPFNARRFGIFFSTVWLGCGVFLIVFAVIFYQATAQSSETQSHGVRETGIVLSDHVNTGRDPSSDVAVRLSAPVDGHDTTTVHIHGVTNYAPGASVTVLVDPQDPGYAELPGHPYATIWLWIFEAVLGGLDVLGYPFVLLFYRRRLRRRWGLQAQG